MAKQSDPADPNKLVRESAGRYRTGDGRFIVEGGSASGWFVADSDQADELGLPLLRGPFGTLDEAQDAVAAARVAPAPKAPTRHKAERSPERPRDRRTAGPVEPDAERKTRRRADEPKAESRPSWLDRLSADQRRVAKQLLSSLEAVRIADAEALVRRDLDSTGALIAGRLLAERAGQEIVESWRAPRWTRAEQRKARTMADGLVRCGLGSG